MKATLAFNGLNKHQHFIHKNYRKITWNFDHLLNFTAEIRWPQKKLDKDVMSANYDVTVSSIILTIFRQERGAILSPSPTVKWTPKIFTPIFLFDTPWKRVSRGYKKRNFCLKFVNKTLWSHITTRDLLCSMRRSFFHVTVTRVFCLLKRGPGIPEGEKWE